MASIRYNACGTFSVFLKTAKFRSTKYTMLQNLTSYPRLLDPLMHRKRLKNLNEIVIQVRFTQTVVSLRFFHEEYMNVSGKGENLFYNNIS